MTPSRLDRPVTPPELATLLTETLAALGHHDSATVAVLGDARSLAARLAAVRATLVGSPTFADVATLLTHQVLTGLSDQEADALAATFAALDAARAPIESYLAQYRALGGTAGAYAALAASQYPDPSPAFVACVTEHGSLVSRVADVLRHAGPASAGADHALALLTATHPTWWSSPEGVAVLVAVRSAPPRCFTADSWFVGWSERMVRASLAYHQASEAFDADSADPAGADRAGRAAAAAALRRWGASEAELARCFSEAPDLPTQFGVATYVDADGVTRQQAAVAEFLREACDLLPRLPGLDDATLAAVVSRGGTVALAALAHPAATVAHWRPLLMDDPVVWLPRFAAHHAGRFHEPEVADAAWMGVARTPSRHWSLVAGSVRKVLRGAQGPSWARGVRTLVDCALPGALAAMERATVRNLTGLSPEDLTPLLACGQATARDAALRLVARVSDGVRPPLAARAARRGRPAR